MYSSAACFEFCNIQPHSVAFNHTLSLIQSHSAAVESHPVAFNHTQPHSVAFSHIQPHSAAFNHIQSHSITFNHTQPHSTALSIHSVAFKRIQSTFERIQPHPKAVIQWWWYSGGTTCECLLSMSASDCMVASVRSSIAPHSAEAICTLR